jgi:hypothetical protein
MSSRRSRFVIALGLLASLFLSQQAHGQITWSQTYLDAAGSGFNDGTVDSGETLSRGALRKNSVNAATTYLNTVLDGRGTVNLTWNTSLNSNSGILASFGANQLVGINGSFQNGGAYQGARANQRPFTGSDASGQFNFFYGWNNSGQANNYAGGSYDFVSVAIHEMSHGLGFLSFASATGQGVGGQTVGSPDIYSMMNKYMVRGSTSPANLFNNTLTNSGYGSFLGPASTFTNGNDVNTGLFYAGQYAMEVYGNEVPLYAPTTFSSGSSVSHVNDSGAVMNPSVAANTIKRFKPYEIAMMMDIGWNQYNWNSTTGNWADGASAVASSRWRTDSGIVYNGASNGNQQFNTNANQGEAPILPVYGQTTANIVLNFKGSAAYTATNDVGSVRLSRMNFTNTAAVTIASSSAGNTINWGLNSDGSASVLVPKIINNATGTVTISSNMVVNNIATQNVGAFTYAGGSYAGVSFTGHSRLTIEGTGTGLMTLSGNILDGSGANAGGGLTKNSSTFNLVLTGTNTYTGTTVVNAGTVTINGNNSAATGAVILNSGGILNGTGTVGGAISVNSSATLRGGDATIGTLVVNNNVSINSTGVLRSRLGASNAADRINMSNAGNILALNNGTVIGLTASGFTGGSSSATFLLADLNGTTNTLLTVNGSNVAANTTIATFTSTTGGDVGTDDSSSLDFNLSGFALTNGQQLQLRRDAVGDLILVFVPVPEPGLMFAGAVALVGLVSVGRRYFARRAV